MAVFDFSSNHLLGTVREVDTGRATVLVPRDESLRRARVGQLVAVKLPGALETWLIGLLDKATKSLSLDTTDPGLDDEELEAAPSLREISGEERVINIVRLTLLGTVTLNVKMKAQFSRSLIQLPNIDAECYLLCDTQLETFMNILSEDGDKEHSLELGRYALDESATAYLDGNRFFQRHAAVVGSTGSGKSWTVASILERAAKLPSANLIVFDLHGEYGKLSYAKHLHIPGPKELGSATPGTLYLPHWLLNAEEMQAMFVDRSEFTAHNQVMAFQDAVIAEKKKILTALGKTETLKAFTLDSPIPYSLAGVYTTLDDLNTELIQGVRGLKQGQFYGQFGRLLARLRSKLSDKRYGFLFQAPESEHQYESMARLAEKLMDFSSMKGHIKVIDFSEVPSDILPVIVGLVARAVYQVQFWTDPENRHPLAFVCDEAHLYLPKKEGKNPIEQRAVENFEKIAKEGRKYGVALLVVSQRPADVSTTILSQCNNVISLRLTNGEDQATVRRLMPESLEGLMDILPIMDIGEALVVGDAVLLPSRIRLTPPLEKPISATIDFWTEWRKTHPEPDFESAVENMRRQGRR